jgi:capsular exopolysaccharide synthesis family protein
METKPDRELGTLNGNIKFSQASPLTYQPEFQGAEKDNLDLRQIATMLRRRWMVIAGVSFAVTGAIVLYTLRQVPIYQGQFQLLVEPVTAQEDQLSQLTSLVGNNNSFQNSKLDYDTQIEVLRSPQIMLGAIEQINAKCTPVTYESLLRNLAIARLKDTKILQIAYTDPKPQQVKCVLDEISTAYISYSQQQRQSSINQGIAFVKSQLPELRQRVDKLQAQLQAFRQQNNLLDPQAQSEKLSELFAAIEQQRVDSLVKLKETQSLYLTLQQQIGLDPDQAVTVAALSDAPRYQKLLDQLQELETKIAVESSRFTQDSPTIQALLEQRRNLLPLLRQEAALVLGNNLQLPGAVSASPNEIRTALTQQLVDAANQIRVIEVRVAGITQAQSILQQQIGRMPLLARQYADIQRELTVATDSLNRFLGVQESLQIESAQNELPWQKLVDPQEPQAPISPSLQRNFVLGIVAGLLLGMGVALLLERLDNVFHTLDELKEQTKLPLLGVIPYNKQLQKISATEIGSWVSEQDRQPTADSQKQPRWYNASPFLEAFRSLHTNISFLGSDTPIRSLVISSATPGEGKSTVAANLAQAAASMGNSVLLVDADMRRPQVDAVLGLENQLGLSNILATDVNPRQAIQPVPGWDNLCALTAGNPLPPDPTRLLGSQKMHELIDYFEGEFDLVIYDTPPVLGLADGRLVSAHTAGLILVVGMGKTERPVVKETLDLLKLSLTTVLGVVANGVNSAMRGSYDYYNKYYNKYYTHEPEGESQLDRAKNTLMKGLGKKE